MKDSIVEQYDARHEFVLAKLAEYRGRWPLVAKGSGVSVRTISKIARGEIKKPGLDHLDDLTGFFRQQKTSHRKAG